MAAFCALNPSAKPTFPTILHPIAECLWILALTVRPNRYRPLLFVPIASLSLWALACSCMRTGSIGVDTGLSSRMMVILMCAIVDILLTSPQEQFGKVEDKKDDDSDAQDAKGNLSSNGHASNGTPRRGSITSAPFMARLKWAMSFWFNPRGIGLPHEPTHVHPPKPPVAATRKHFYLQQLRAFVFYYLCLDAVFNLGHLYDARRRWLVEQGLYGPLNPWRLLSLPVGSHVGIFMYMELIVVSTVGVVLGLSSPQQWPELFNTPAEAFTLKRFWGKFWHQMYRRHFSVLSDFLVHRVLRLSRSKRKYTGFLKVSLAFIISALLHFCGDALTLQSLSKSGSLQFFCLQPVGLLVEDLVITLWRRYSRQPTNRPSTAFKLLGYLWVILWIGYTTSLWIDPQLDAGYLEDISTGLPSVLLGLLKGQWQWPADNRWIWTEM